MFGVNVKHVGSDLHTQQLEARVIQLEKIIWDEITKPKFQAAIDEINNYYISPRYRIGGGHYIYDEIKDLHYYSLTEFQPLLDKAVAEYHRYHCKSKKLQNKVKKK